VQDLAPMREILLGDPSALVRTLVVGVFAYLGLIAILRASGNRTLAKLNAFDLVVTVALGSTLATILLSREVALAQGLLALALLVALQYVITWSSVRWPRIRRIVTGDPRLLLYRGQRLPDEQQRARVADEELLAAARSAGYPALDEVTAIVLETDGSLSVIADADAVALEGIPGPKPPARPTEQASA
jgi:uncharacterized membrane protein YcaP (DUF421 family)